MKSLVYPTIILSILFINSSGNLNAFNHEKHTDSYIDLTYEDFVFRFDYKGFKKTYKKYKRKLKIKEIEIKLLEEKDLSWHLLLQLLKNSSENLISLNSKPAEELRIEIYPYEEGNNCWLQMSIIELSNNTLVFHNYWSECCSPNPRFK